MPSRITSTSASVIDHMYYFEGKNVKCEHNVNAGTCGVTLPTTYQIIFLLLAISRANFRMMNGLMLEFIQIKIF